MKPIERYLEAAGKATPKRDGYAVWRTKLAIAALDASADIKKLVALNKALLDTTDATEIAVIKDEIRELVS